MGLPSDVNVGLQTITIPINYSYIYHKPLLSHLKTNLAILGAPLYPLVKTNIAIENHNFIAG